MNLRLEMGVARLRCLITGLSLWRLRFNPSPVCVRLVADKVVLGHVFLPVLFFFLWVNSTKLHSLSFCYYCYKKSKWVKHGEPSHKHCCLRHVGWEGALDKNVPLPCRFKSFRMWHCIFWGWVVPNISKNCPHDSVTLQNTWHSIRLLWEPQILYFHIEFVRLKRVSQVHICIQTWTGGRRKLCFKFSDAGHPQ
jgi:hypothetical protein